MPNGPCSTGNLIGFNAMDGWLGGNIPRRSGVANPFPAALLVDLISYWKQNEASGDALDSHGANTLADNNGVTSAPGIIGTSRQYTAASSQFFSIADNPSLSVDAEQSFTFSLWTYFDSLGADRFLIDKTAGTGDDAYLLMYQNVSGFFRFGCGDADRVLASTFGVPPLATWIYVVVWHDAVANTINIQVNDGAVDSTAQTVPPSDNGAAFTLGAASNGLSGFHNGRLDAVGFWKRVLTPAERTYLYNGGVGRDYPF